MGTTTNDIPDEFKFNHFKKLDLVKCKKLTYIWLKLQYNKTDQDLLITDKQIFVLGKAIHYVLQDIYLLLNILVNYLKL